MKCWIIDDEKKIVDYLSHVIDWSYYGFSKLQTFTSSKEVLFRLEKGEFPDLLLTDIKMPEVSGLDLSQRVEGKTKVVIISGYSEFSYAQKAIRYGVAGYLLKPIFADDLEAVVEKVVKEISVEGLVQEVNLKDFYLSFFADRINSDANLLSCYRSLTKQGYAPQELLSQEEALLTFSFRQKTFGFMLQKEQQMQDENQILPYFFEAVFHTSLAKQIRLDKQMAELIEQRNWKQLLMELRQVMADQEMKTIMLQLEIICLFNQELPWVFQTSSFSELLTLITDRQLADFIEQQLKEQILSPQEYHRTILSLQEYICSHLSSPLSLELLADKVHMHPVYLSKVFKEKTGQKLSQFILEQRLFKMKELLLTTDLKVKTITELVGYHKPQNINDFFKKRFGYSPTDYRRIHQIQGK